MNLFVKTLIFLSFATSGWSQVLDMNDVSILLPAPKIGEENLLIKTSDLTRTGQPLFPADVLFVGFELEMGTRSMRQTDSFRVIGIRLDHFMRQLYINFVWQKPENGGIYTQASIHSSHTILDLQFFLDKLEALNRKYKRVSRNGRLPLQVNPTISAEGLTGPYYHELKKIIMEHINPADRVTFRSFRRTDWATGFAGWDMPIDGSRPSVSQFLTIPEVQSVQEPFKNWETYVPFSYLEIKNRLFSNIITVGGLPPFVIRNFQPLIEDSDRAQTMPERKLLEMIGRVYMVENPRIIPGIVQTECMSCHFAQAVRSMTKKLRPELPYDQFSDKLIFKSTVYNTENLSPAQRTNLTMAFGYAENTAVWSQRVINETAETLEMIYGNRGRFSSVRIQGGH